LKQPLIITSVNQRKRRGSILQSEKFEIACLGRVMEKNITVHKKGDSRKGKPAR